MSCRRASSKSTFGFPGEDLNFGGDFDITDTVTIQGAGAGLTVINAHQLDRVFDVIGSAPSPIKVVLQGLTIRNGKVTEPGGGIQVADADLVVRDGVVTGNRASQEGGGISNGVVPGTGNVTLVRSTVSRNVSGTVGGGLSVTGANHVLTVKDSTVRRNIAAIGGGGILAIAATLTNSTISGNTSGGSGGGIEASAATLINSTVSGNSADSSGGGIRASTATLTNSTVSGNSATGAGGGIQANSTATLTRCTVSGNHTNTDGGGIWTNSTATLTNSTVSGNSAANEGGGVCATTATLLNCTVVGEQCPHRRRPLPRLGRPVQRQEHDRRPEPG